MELRAAAASDAAALRRLDALTSTPEVTPAAGRAPRAPAPADTLVAVVDGEVAGYVELRPATPLESNRHVLEITGLAVDPARRRGGVGRALVEAAAAEAARRGARRLRLRVLAPNAPARALYGACGFVVEGVLREEFRLAGRYVDDVLMVRELVPPAADAAVVVITGAPGAGKTSATEALSGLLAGEGVAHAAFETEQLAWGEPWPALTETLPQLSAVCALQRAAGRRLLLLVATTETEAELHALLAATGAPRRLVVCLAVAPETASARVAAREPDWWAGKPALVAHAAELAAAIPALPGVDVVVSGEGRDAREVAREVRGALAARGVA
jgi:ribosomal protein S18 acetylase RimI-like enzyme